MHRMTGHASARSVVFLHRNDTVADGMQLDVVFGAVSRFRVFDLPTVVVLGKFDAIPAHIASAAQRLLDLSALLRRWFAIICEYRTSKWKRESEGKSEGSKFQEGLHFLIAS